MTVSTSVGRLNREPVEAMPVEGAGKEDAHSLNAG